MLGPRTKLYDAICAIPDTLEGFTIYIFSDGWDNFSLFTIEEAIEKLEKLGLKN